MTGIPVIDVRSPSEYMHAHIPGSKNIPLFSDEERKVVGTAYKQESRAVAIKMGLGYFGPKMREIVEAAEEITQPGKEIIVHCWRGGMRSAGVAWLLDLYGYKVYTLVGGYKSYRKWCLDLLQKDHRLAILGGYTGSGKTEVLAYLKAAGECIIDLEGLANHKGSAFGAIGQPAQPSQEMFENLVAMNLFRTGAQNKLIWVEDESQRIGLVNIPQPLWNTMRRKPVFFMDIPFEERLDYIVKHYGQLDRGALAAAVLRIQKRLGGLEAKYVLGYLAENDIKSSFRILLHYYDKHYKKGLWNRDNVGELVKQIEAEKSGDKKSVKAILECKELVYGK